MLRTVDWNVIKEVHKNMSLDPKTILNMQIILESKDIQQKAFRFEDFLPIMWRLFDSPRVIRKLTVMREAEIIYSYEFKTNEEKTPSTGDGDIVLNFKSLTPSAKSVHIDLLLSQILEANYDRKSV